MTDIRALAEAEKQAEANRKNADAAYRKAWWSTSYALGGISDTLKRRAAVNLVSQITGTNSGYVTSRAKAATMLRNAGITKAKASKLPPRMTLEVTRIKDIVVTQQLVNRVLRAEAGGMSLREFSRELTGKSWADTPEGASMETVQQIIASQPQLVGQLVAQHEAASRAHDGEVLRKHEREGHLVTRPADWDSAEHVLTQLTLAIKALRRECDKPGDLTENARATIRWAQAELTAIEEGRDFVGEVESWLEGNTV